MKAPTTWFPRGPAGAGFAAATAGLALILLTGSPSGIPVNDAGAYHRMVGLWADAGHPVFIGWNEMTLLGHLAWGLAARAVGLGSVSALQLLTGVQAALVCLFLAVLLNRSGLAQRDAALTSLVWLAGPVALFSAVGFMTEVPTAFWTVVWLAALAAWVRHPRTGWWVVWVAAAVCAFSVRQTALVLPLATLGAVKAAPGRRRSMAAGAVAAVAIDALIWGYRSTLPLASIRPLAAVWSGAAPVLAAWLAVRHLAEAAVTIGVLLAPLAIAILAADRRGCVTRWGAIPAGAAALPIVLSGTPFPFWGNILTRAGVLPDTLPPHSVLPVVLSQPVAWALTLAGLASLAVLASSVLVRGVARSPAAATAALATAGFLCTVTIARAPWDRYVVTALPVATAAIILARCSGRLEPRTGQSGGAGTGRLWSVPAVAVLIASATLSVVAVRGYLSRQRAVWATARDVVADGVAPKDVDAGFEWNLWHQPVPFDPGRSRPPGAVDVWYEAYPFSRLRPRVRLWIGEPPSGWAVVGQRPIPGGLTISLLERPPTAAGGRGPPGASLAAGPRSPL